MKFISLDENQTRRRRDYLPPSSFIFRIGEKRMPIKDAKENDIQAMRKRLQEAREQRMLDIQLRETVSMVNKHKQEVNRQ